MQKEHHQLSTLQSSCPMSSRIHPIFSENNFSRAKKTEELLKTQGAHAWFQSRRPVPPAITAELLRTPRGPLWPRCSQLLWHCCQHDPGTAASVSLALRTISKPEASKDLIYILQGPNPSRLPKAPNAKPTVGSTSTSALGITSWPARSLIKQQLGAELATYPWHAAIQYRKTLFTSHCHSWVAE